MIKPTELRIGNYFHPTSFANGVKFQATGIVYRVGSVNKFGDVEVIEPTEPTKIFKAGEMAPITLTEEWLMALGFIDPSENGWGYRLPVNSADELCWYKQDNGIRYQTKGSGFTRDFGIKYVHQLQNLYYALTGEELRLKSALPK